MSNWIACNTKEYTLLFESVKGLGREIPFTFTISALSEQDACTIASRMENSMDWVFKGILP